MRPAPPRPFALTLDALRLTRRQLETLWPPAAQGGPSHGQCLRTTWVTQQLFGGLTQAGWPREDGQRRDCGFFSQGEWHFHYWLRTGGMIVDLSADQFGAAPVILTPHSPHHRACASTAQMRLDLKDTPLTARPWASAIRETLRSQGHP